jgi:hypothetical protein
MPRVNAKSVLAESHEQDGERLRATCLQTASGDPAMAFGPSVTGPASQVRHCRQHVAAGPCAADAT